MHIYVRERLLPVLDLFSSMHGSLNLMLGSHKGGTPAMVYFTVMQAMELGRDRHDAACVGGGDVERFHDSVAWGGAAAITPGQGS